MATQPKQGAMLPTKSPNMPLSPEVPDRKFMDDFQNALRLYFNQNDNVNGGLLGRNGGQYIECPVGLFFNTADQTFAATGTAYPVVYNATYLNNAVALQTGSTSRIEVSISGVYNFQYTGQVLSSSASAKTIYLWIKRNGVNIGYSTRAETLTINNGFRGINYSFDIDLAAGEYLELEAAVTDTDLKLDAVVATSPHPGIPSSVMSVNYIGPLPDPRPTPP
jgi:hypothetical protein